MANAEDVKKRLKDEAVAIIEKRLEKIKARRVVLIPKLWRYRALLRKLREVQDR